MPGTGVLDINSVLVRKKWVREGLIQKKSKSFWSQFTGTTDSSVVYQSNDASKKEGHQIVFDYSGNLSGRARKGKETAFGTGEAKKRFSDKVTIDRYRQVVDNGDAFDAIEGGDLSLSQHSDSRSKLSDLFIRFKDQGMFDCAQGNLTQTTTHNIDLGTVFTMNTLSDIEDYIKTSTYTTGGMRRPLQPYQMDDNDDPVWLFLVDSTMLTKLKQSGTYQTLMSQGDKRGDKNRVIRGKVGRIGQLVIVEASRFFGATDNTTSGWGLNQSDIEISGLRQYKGDDPNTAVWTGQEGFNSNGDKTHSRSVLLGAGAIQFAVGKEPDYRMKGSQDFDIKSESVLESWLEIQKAKMVSEGEDYVSAKVSGIDWGVVTVDVEI